MQMTPTISLADKSNIHTLSLRFKNLPSEAKFVVCYTMKNNFTYVQVVAHKICVEKHLPLFIFWFVTTLFLVTPFS